MKTFLSTKIVPAALALAAVGGAVGASATEASAATKTHTATGVVASVKTGELVVKVGKASDHFKTSAKTKVTVASKASTLTSLKAGEAVTVTYRVAGKTWTASSVVAKKA